MGTIYKRKGRNGRPYRNYTISYQDATGKRCTVTSGTSDKRVAQRILAEMQSEVALIASGVVDPLQERYKIEARKPASQHLEEYLAACRDKQAGHGLKQKERHLKWLLDATAAVKLTDILPDVVDAQLSVTGLRARGQNLKLECANAFLNWLVKNGRLRNNPLKIVPRRNEVLDKAYERRALTGEEVTGLLQVARERAAESPAASLRPLWYMLPLLAGLRRGDLERLTWGALDLKKGILTIRGGKAKKRVDRLPLHPELLAEIKAVRPRTVLPSARVFVHLVSNATRQEDFRRAGIELENDRGEKADLHALRVTFGTRLALSGVTPAVHQRLLRHSTVELTMRYYTKLGLDDLLEHGIDLLPGLGEGESKPSQAAS